MHRNYLDIINRISDPVLWYDDHAVPRFEPFHPQLCGVYHEVAALVEIACQSCKQKFDVAITFGPLTDYYQEHDGSWTPREEWTPTKKPFAFHYGDPPSHDCTGDTMNCDDLRVKEYWVRPYNEAPPEGHPDSIVDRFEWHRVESEEIPLEDFDGKRA